MVFIEGGDGGFGNAHYKTSTNQAPRRGDPGWPAPSVGLAAPEADRRCGLVGLPNAGKSTFLAACPARGPRSRTILHDAEAAAWGGPARRHGIRSRRSAGPHRGASEGAGLGHRFLGHVERCAVILHLIDGTEEDVVGAYRASDASSRPTAMALPRSRSNRLNKADAIDEAQSK